MFNGRAASLTRGVRYSRAEVRSALASYGALFWREVPAPSVALETLLAQALHHAHDDASLAQALPFVLWRNRSRLNVTDLVRNAREAGEDRALGFVLDLTTRLSGDPTFAEWAKVLFEPSHEPTYFFPNDADDPWSRELAEKRSPEEARRWGYLMNMDVETFASHFRKASIAAA